MYASLWMLLLPFGAMKGWRGTVNEPTGSAVDGEPMNFGPGSCNGIEGIGIAGMPGSAAGAAIAPASTRSNSETGIKRLIGGRIRARPGLDLLGGGDALLGTRIRTV